MRITQTASTAAIALTLVARVVSAQTAAAAPATHHVPSVETVYKQIGLVAHAAKGQTVDQQKIDAHQCFEVAKGQTGFDPLSAASADPAAAAAAAEKQTADATQGATVVGAAKGAAGGALIGAAAGDAGKGAAIGAATGAVVGRSRKKRAEKQAASQAAAATAGASSQQLGAFKKAAGSCLQSRGYTLG